MLLGLVMLVVGVLRQDPKVIATGVALGCLAGLELSVREHLAGYRSHTTLLAGVAFVGVVGGLYYFSGLILLICLIAGAVAFAGAALAMRAIFRRASGGLSFRVGSLRG